MNVSCLYSILQHFVWDVLTLTTTVDGVSLFSKNKGNLKDIDISFAWIVENLHYKIPQPLSHYYEFSQYKLKMLTELNIMKSHSSNLWLVAYQYCIIPKRPLPNMYSYNTKLLKVLEWWKQIEFKLTKIRRAFAQAENQTQGLNGRISWHTYRNDCAEWSLNLISKRSEMPTGCQGGKNSQ